MKVLVIPDIHLKVSILNRAKDILRNHSEVEGVIFLGDYVDDWGCEFNILLYRETIKELEKFYDSYKNEYKIYFCIGNHDYCYTHGTSNSGTSEIVRSEVEELLKNFEKKVNGLHIIIKIDNVFFSHAGISEDWIEMEDRNNKLWNNLSPLWVRPQLGEELMYDKFQVVGHTPVKYPTECDRILSVDTFSTDCWGKNIGNCKFVIVDTKEESWRTINE